MYAERDLERLEQIIALKFLGIPLKQIKIVLDRPALKLPDTLRLQRKALEERQELLSRAIRALRLAEDALETGKGTEPAILKKAQALAVRWTAHMDAARFPEFSFVHNARPL